MRYDRILEKYLFILTLLVFIICIKENYLKIQREHFFPVLI